MFLIVSEFEVEELFKNLCCVGETLIMINGYRRLLQHGKASGA